MKQAKPTRYNSSEIPKLARNIAERMEDVNSALQNNGPHMVGLNFGGGTYGVRLYIDRLHMRHWANGQTLVAVCYFNPVTEGERIDLELTQVMFDKLERALTG